MGLHTFCILLLVPPGNGIQSPVSRDSCLARLPLILSEADFANYLVHLQVIRFLSRRLCSNDHTSTIHPRSNSFLMAGNGSLSPVSITIVPPFSMQAVSVTSTISAPSTSFSLLLKFLEKRSTLIPLSRMACQAQVAQTHKISFVAAA